MNFRSMHDVGYLITFSSLAGIVHVSTRVYSLLGDAVFEVRIVRLRRWKRYTIPDSVVRLQKSMAKQFAHGIQ